MSATVRASIQGQLKAFLRPAWLPALQMPLLQRQAGFKEPATHRIAGETVPVAAFAKRGQPLFPQFTLQLILVDQHQQLHLKLLPYPGQDLVDLFPHLNVADQLAVDPPGAHHPQGEGAELAQLQPAYLPAGFRRGRQGEAFHGITVARRVVDAEKIHPLRQMKIEMGDHVLLTDCIEAAFAAT